MVTLKPKLFVLNIFIAVVPIGRQEEWNLPSSWKLIAEMPFGVPVQKPGEKEFKPLTDRFKVYK